APAMNCPQPVAGDGLLTGVPDGRFYLVTDPSGAGTSNMAFQLERHLDVAYLPSGVPTQNVYFVSMPGFSGQGDTANTAAPESDKCVGDVAGPSAGDGLIDADDLICSWWSSRASGAGSFMVSLRDEASASWLDRTGFVDPAGAID